ncbi:MAG TPA: LysR family transcriptional regulator [Luteolibacter sp.]|nr:LysR family transcriptional regulator [Luteolibacter sp.]
MSQDSAYNHISLQELPSLSFHHLEVLQTVQREGSYSNAALELHTNRANIKRICSNFEEELGHAIFHENEAHEVTPTALGMAILTSAAPLTRSLLHLGEGIRAIQRKGLILRFAASSDFFSGGAFSYILSRMDLVDLYRPCYLRIEVDRFNAALLSSECDVYFGAGISASQRLEIIHLDRVPWSFHPGKSYSGKNPSTPADLISGKWVVQPAGDAEAAEVVVEELSKQGAGKGRVLSSNQSCGDDEILLRPEASWIGLVNPHPDWPSYLFSAALKKQHPYGELIARLRKAARV